MLAAYKAGATSNKIVCKEYVETAHSGDSVDDFALYLNVSWHEIGINTSHKLTPMYPMNWTATDFMISL